MKRTFIVTALLFTVVTLFSQVLNAETEAQPWKFSIKLLSLPFATETVSFSSPADDSLSRTFESKTFLTSQGVKGTFLTKGKIENQRIVEYTLDSDYNNAKIKIDASVKEDILTVTYGDKAVQIPWKENTILLDNNLSFMWQLFLFFYHNTAFTSFEVVIPQLITKSESIVFPLSIEQSSERDGEITLIFKLVNSNGVIKMDANYRLMLIQLGASKVEREE